MFLRATFRKLLYPVIVNLSFNEFEVRPAAWLIVCKASVPDTVEVLAAAKKYLACGYGRRSAEYLVELVDGEYLELRARLDDVTLAVFGLDVDLAVAGYR